MSSLVDDSLSLIDFEQLPVQSDNGIKDSGRIASYGAHKNHIGRRQRPPNAYRSRSRQRLASSGASGAAHAREVVSSLGTSDSLLDCEEFDPALLEASFSQYTRSSSSSRRLSSIPLEDRNNLRRHLSPPRREPQPMMTPQSLPELYIEVVRRGRNSRFCLQCNHSFEVGSLQLGYTVDTLFPNQQARWIHVDCATNARLRLQGGSVKVSMSPDIPLSLQDDLIIKLRRLCTFSGTTEIRKWNYLAASVKQWPTHLLSDWEEDGFNGQSIVGDELPAKRELEVSTILASLPSYPLDSDADMDNPCAVCHVAMRQGDMICRLPCHHMYHVGCIDSWLRVRTTCPLDNLRISDMLDKMAEETAGEDVIVVEA